MEEATTRSRISIIDQDGKKRRIDNLPEVFEGIIYKITNKRYKLAEERLYEAVKTESHFLFSTLLQGIDVPNPPYWVTNQGLAWQSLSQKWIKAKKHSNFWYGKRDRGGNYTHLKDWVKQNIEKENDLLGKPIVYAARNLEARGYQRATIFINPFPKKLSSIHSVQLNKLFKDNGSGKSNEEARPLVNPALLFLMETRIMKVAKQILKETMENG